MATTRRQITARRRRRAAARSRVLGIVAGGGLVAAMLVSAAVPTVAATGDSSASSGQFLSGSLLPLDLSTVAGIDGAQAAYADGVTPGPSTEESAGLDVTALSLLTVTIPGGVSLPLGDLLQLGAVNQYAWAGPTGVSRAASGTVDDSGAVDTSGTGDFPADASLDLTSLLGSTAVLDQAGLTLRAVTGVAALDAAPGAIAETCADLSAPVDCRDYAIAGADLDLSSPAIGTMIGTVDGAAAGLSATLNGLTGAITSGLTGALDTVLGAIAAVPGISVSGQPTVTITADIAGALAPVLQQTVSAGGVSIDLADGTIAVDLAQFLDLNDLPPSSSLLSPEVLQAVADQVGTLLAGVQNQLNAVMAGILDSVAVTVTGGYTVDSVLGPAGVTLSYTGSLQDLLTGDQLVGVSGTGLAAIVGPVLSGLPAAIPVALAPVLVTAQGAVTVAGQTISGAVTTLTNALAPALTGLGDLAEVLINVQEQDADGAGTFTETAVRVSLLGDAAARLDLGKAVVGPNVANVFVVALAATDTPAGQPTTVTGDGWPASTVVTLQLTDPLGAPVGDPVTVTTDGDGNIPAGTTVPVPAGSAPGTYSVVGTTAGGESATAPFQVTDATAPAAPVVTAPADGSVTADDTPTITGTGEPGATVTVTEGGTTICTAVVQPGGTWTCTPTTPLDDGDHTITATQTDPSGNTSPVSDPVTFTVDTAAPAAPVITAPADGGTTNDTTPAITGTGEPGATVTVTEGGTTICTATVQPGGTWTCTPTTPLTEGDHTVTATQTDPAGNTSPASDPVTFTVDTTPPAAPVITGPADGATVGDDTPTITGTGEPGATVTVTEGGTTLCTAVVQPGGAWTCTPTTPLADGDHTITATQTDPAGNTSPASGPVTFTVDTTAPAPPVITAPVSGSSTSDTTPTVSGTGEPGSTVTVTDQGGAVLGTAVVTGGGTWSFDSVPLTDGTYTITATQTDAGGTTSPDSSPVIFTVDTAAPAAPVVTAPADGGTTNDATPAITGTGEPGATVTVTEGGTTICTATVQPGGTWTCTPTTPLTEGDHTITATQTDPAGNTSPASDPVTFAVDTTPPAAPVITAPADGDATNDSTPTVSGTGEPGATVTVTDGGTIVCTATVQPDSTWSCTPTTPLVDGAHTLVATQTDPAGNTSPASDTVTVTVDAAAAPPVITGPAGGTHTDDTTPPVTGTGEPGATVTVTEGATTVCTATVQPDGTWTCTPATPFGEGDHTLTATQTDLVRNTSQPSAPVTFAVDTTPPPAPVITGPADGSTTDDATPTVGGTGEPGATVTVTDGGTTVCTATVQPDGTWTCTPATPLVAGAHTLVATQTDAAGNTGPASDPVVVVVSAAAARQLTSWFDRPVVHRGDVQVFHAGGFEPAEQVDAVIRSVPVDLPVTTADADGVAHWTFVVPADFEPATHTGTATSVPVGDSTSSTFLVIVDLAATGGGTARLALTGADASSELALAALLLVVGAMAVAAGRRPGGRRG